MVSAPPGATAALRPAAPPTPVGLPYVLLGLAALCLVGARRA